MDAQLPSAEEIRGRLAPLTLRQIERLADLSGVPATTIYKIKRGETKNPGVETLRQFMPHVDAALIDPAAGALVEPARAA